ncbi:MAG: M18 family aminopeptidase [Candidatus Fimimonas sp.]
MDILEFLNSSYTAYHTTENVVAILQQNGFCKLPLSEWKLQKGGKYYTTQNGSSVVAFRVGENKVFNVCESHTDSPCFKLKGGSVLTSCGINRLNTEKYGGGLIYSFFDRPLKIAGRLLVEKDGALLHRKVASSYNVVIPSLAIHHNPTANDGIAFNLQNDTLPLFSQSEKDLFATLTEEKVVDSDLFVVPATQAFFAGAENEFLCSARLDNLTSVFASVCALAQCEPQNIAVVACLDNEEIGSGTRHGSPDFLKDVLAKIQRSLGFSEAEKENSLQQGMVLSVDNGHAIHPAHPEKSDPEKNVKLNGGVVVKHHPNYATDGLTSAIFKLVLQKENVPVQDYYNRSDVRCGSTLGLATSKNLQTKTCDIGLAQLAMHSACETVGAKDVAAMQQALRLFLSANIVDDGEKIEIL